VSRTLKDTPAVKKARNKHLKPKRARLMRNAMSYACCDDLTTRAMEKRLVIQEIAEELWELTTDIQEAN
jgi:hypothetical protein